MLSHASSKPGRNRIAMSQKETIKQLNETLRMQLTCINQCFLHARILKHRGLMALADGEFKESLDSMKFADQLVERILALGGMPNMQPLGEVKVGEAREAMLACDLELKQEIKSQIETALAACAQNSDLTSVSLLEKILASVNEHICYINSQIGQLDAA